MKTPKLVLSFKVVRIVVALVLALTVVSPVFAQQQQAAVVGTLCYYYKIDPKAKLYSVSCADIIDVPSYNDFSYDVGARFINTGVTATIFGLHKDAPGNDTKAGGYMRYLDPSRYDAYVSWTPTGGGTQFFKVMTTVYIPRQTADWQAKVKELGSSTMIIETCAGVHHGAALGYDQLLVVTAEPLRISYR